MGARDGLNEALLDGRRQPCIAQRGRIRLGHAILLAAPPCCVMPLPPKPGTKAPAMHGPAKRFYEGCWKGSAGLGSPGLLELLEDVGYLRLLRVFQSAILAEHLAEV
jgi:hypothetical protein